MLGVDKGGFERSQSTASLISFASSSSMDESVSMPERLGLSEISSVWVGVALLMVLDSLVRGVTENRNSRGSDCNRDREEELGHGVVSTKQSRMRQLGDLLAYEYAVRSYDLPGVHSSPESL